MVEDDEMVAYYDDYTGYFYDCDGQLIDLAPDGGSQEGDEVDRASLEGGDVPSNIFMDDARSGIDSI